jgi:hypothetical protein
MDSNTAVKGKRKRSSSSDEKDEANSSKINCYKGYTWQNQSAADASCSSTSSSSNLELDAVEATISPEEFFNRFIAPRRPCIITKFKGLSITLEDLVRKTGEMVGVLR